MRHVPEEADGARTTKPLRVIVADDDPLARRVVRDALEAGGIVVIAEAANGREAVELSLYYKPDVVLMDLVMPDVDGIQATRRILAREPDVEVVILTSSDDDDVGPGRPARRRLGVPQQARRRRRAAARPARRGRRRGRRLAPADDAPRRHDAAHARRRHGHPPGAQPAHPARVGGPRPPLHGPVDGRDRRVARALVGDRALAHQEPAAQARRQLAPGGRRGGAPHAGRPRAHRRRRSSAIEAAAA